MLNWLRNLVENIKIVLVVVWELLTETQLGCGLLVLLVNLLAGGWSVNYLLNFFIGKTIPFIGALVIGLIGGEVTIPVAIVVAILKSANIL